MPPIEHAIVAGVLCWRFMCGSRKWRVVDLASLTSEIVELRKQAGVAPYPVSEDQERIGLGETE